MKYIIILLIIASVLLTACKTDTGPTDGRYDALAKCLTEKGVTMYGTEWCPHCKNQKAAFGSSFQYVNYVDCDKNMNACQNAGVEGYPTWVINDVRYPGEQNLYTLANNAGCSDTLA